MNINLIFWIGFILLFISMISIDMLISGKRLEVMKLKSAVLWTAAWISLTALFAVSIFLFYPEGHIKGMEFVTGYLIEYSLSVDNLFVFILIFNTMGISQKNQPRILKWGILGAIILRILFILIGVGLMNAFHFTIYIFGAILVFTSIKMILTGDEKIHPEKNPLVKWAKKIFNIDSSADTDHFFIKKDGMKYATMAFLTLLLVESTDVIFAVDSIPAVLAITKDTFIIITSNLFAILGLRALYFTLAGILDLFRFLKYGISFILFFVGVKMIVSGFFPIPVNFSLIVIALAIALSIITSLLIKPKKR